ncbi:MAG: sulfatase [Deltaproteobacteria bacterium]|nr:sulfatase [Deltaproteobacteria bacterium]
MATTPALASLTAFGGRPSRFARALGRYGTLVARPFELLVGQLVAFLAISLFVKFVQMRETTDYGVAWVGGGRFLTNCFHFALFSAQEFAVFTVLLVTVLLWKRCVPRPGRWSRSLVGVSAFLVLPALSVIEVLEIAHFKLFLAPLGPEELRMISWTGQIVTAGNVLGAPEVLAGLVLVLAGYYLAPPGLWLPRWDVGHQVAVAGVALLASVVTAILPKPVLSQALLAPHPLLWMVVGSRSGSGLAVADDGGAVTPFGRTGHRRFAVKERPTNVIIFVLESTRAASLALYNPAAPAGRELLRWRDEMVVFDNIYAPVPTSAHAIFSILYGVYPYLGPFWTSTGASVVTDSMAQLFGRAGYATQFFITGDLNYDNIRSFAGRGFDRVLDTNDWPGQENYALLPWGRDDRLLIEQIKRFLVSKPQRPYFLFAMTSNPHHPYSVAHLPPLQEGAVRPAAAVQDVEPETVEWKAAYERLVDYDLHLLSDLYGWMKKKGFAERTLLLVLGDHGEAFGEHPGNFGHAAFIYEENVHVPCFILHPRRLGLPRHIPQLGSEVDLRATILDILGWRHADPGSGMSLLYEDRGRVIANFTENGVSRFGLRDARFTYIFTPHTEAEQVFERSRDPREKVDLAARDPLVRVRYRTRLQRWETEHERLLEQILR